MHGNTVAATYDKSLLLYRKSGATWALQTFGPAQGVTADSIIVGVSDDAPSTTTVLTSNKTHVYVNRVQWVEGAAAPSVQVSQVGCDGKLTLARVCNSSPCTS